MDVSRRIPCLDEAGHEYTVVEYTNSRISPLLSDEGRRLSGGAKWFLSTGEDVNMVDEDTFQVVQRDVVLRRSGLDQRP